VVDRDDLARGALSVLEHASRVTEILLI